MIASTLTFALSLLRPYLPLLLLLLLPASWSLVAGLVRWVDSEGRG